MAQGAIQIDKAKLATVAGGHGHRSDCVCNACQNNISLADRIRAKVAANSDGCWIWTGKVAVDGYGMIRVEGKEMRAHRAAYHAFVRPLRSGEMACHRCDNPRCVNPSHIFPGTRADNNRDMAAKGRARNRNMGKPECDHGHPFSNENTIIDRKGHRNCRECHRQKLRRYRAAKKELAA